MKIMVIGLGQCGSRIAEEFISLNSQARSTRSVDVVTGAIAVDTDAALLAGLRVIKANPRQQIVLGEAKLRGQGTSKQHELGSQISSDEGLKVIDAIRGTKRISETDAFVVVAGAAGGMGGGGLPVFVKLIKEHYPDKPVFSLAILPFEHEESLEEKIVHNVARCLDEVYPISDAVFIFDNQKQVRKGLSIGSNLDNINKLIASPFYNLLCAGEQNKRREIALNVMQAGEITQLLKGWTAIGYGKALLNIITLPWDKSKSMKKNTERIKRGIEATDEALNELSVQCNPKDSASAIFLISAPTEEIEIDLVKNFGEHLRSIAPDAVIRYGDYPVEKALIDVTLVLSGLKNIPKINNYLGKVGISSSE